MKSLSKSILAAAIVMTAVFSSSVSASDYAEAARMSPESGSAGVSTFAVLAKGPAVASNGVQFQIKYDPKQVRVASVSDCLIGLPKELSQGLNSCRHIADQNLVQVVVADLTQSNLVSANLEIGMVEFEPIGKLARTSSNAVWLEGIHIAGMANEKANAEVSIEKKINY